MRIRCTSRAVFMSDLVNFIIESYCVLLSWIIWCIPTCIINWAVVHVFPSTGIELNGPNAWDPKILDRRFYSTLAWGGFGFYKSLKKKWVQVDDPTQFSYRICTSPCIKKYGQWLYPLKFLHRWFDLQPPQVASESILKSYEYGSDVFALTMGSNIQFSTCYWPEGTTTMEEAAIAKMDLVGRKLKLKPGMTVLDIGCGWGTLAKHLAENFGVTVTGVTLSMDGCSYAKSICKGLSAEFFCLDYRLLNPKTKFDRIVSIEMFEHVGPAQHRNYFKKVDEYLKNDGLFVFQVEYTPYSWLPNCDMADRVDFKNIWFPYVKEIWKAYEGIFIMEDFQSLSGHAVKTFYGITENHRKNKDQLISKLGEEDYFKWSFGGEVLLGVFKSRVFDVCQIVFSKAGTVTPYESER